MDRGGFVSRDRNDFRGSGPNHTCDREFFDGRGGRGGRPWRGRGRRGGQIRDNGYYDRHGPPPNGAGDKRMMEASQDFVYTESMKDLQERLGTMFNNAAHADTVFSVEQTKFHVLGQLVAVASGKLNDVMSKHFANCEGREIRLHDVKCGESFAVILKYLYGQDINLGQLKMNVLCEAINLAETYQLVKFSNDLKQFLSKVDVFQLDSLAVLLNTSRKCNASELYEKAKVFAFEHAEDFVKHESIVNVQYEVLLDLIKSDWFCAPEIDILMGVLNWHHGMSTKDTLDSTESETNVQNDDASSVGSDQSEASTVLLSNDNSDDNDEVKVEAKSADSCNTKTLAVMTNADNLSVVMKSFTENALKSMLLHIRIKQITAFDLLGASQTNLFLKYKHVLGDRTLFSQASEPRQKYGTVVSETKNEAISHESENIDNETPEVSEATTRAPADSNVHGDEPVNVSSGQTNNTEVVTIAPNIKLFNCCNIRRTIIGSFLPNDLFVRSVSYTQYPLFSSLGGRTKTYTHYTPPVVGNNCFVIGDLKWSFYFTYSPMKSGQRMIEEDNKFMKVRVEACAANRSGDYECTAQCQISLVSLPCAKHFSWSAPQQTLKFHQRTSPDHSAMKMNSTQGIGRVPDIIEICQSQDAGEFFCDQFFNQNAHVIFEQDRLQCVIDFNVLRVEWK